MRLRLESRSTRRALVIAAGLLWAVLVLPFPRSLNGAGMPLTLALLTVDVALGTLTGWLAFARSASLDERQSGHRDRGYRIAFRLLALGVVFMIIALVVGSSTADYSGGWPQPVFGSRWIVGLLQLLLAMPTAVIAWLQPESVDELSAAPDDESKPRRWLSLLVVPALAAFWLLAVGVMPVRASGVQDDGMHGSMTDATCGHFVASREVAYGFGAQVRLDVEPCWDGKRALTYPGEQREFLSRCFAVPGTADFANVRLTCTERTDDSGTLHYMLRAAVESGLGPAVTRNVQLELAVTKDGRVTVTPAAPVTP